MQLMWYTTAWLNGYLGTRWNPDRLYDNIELGVSYLAILWNDFHGNLDDLISAYNEGERAVRTYGIFNWWYVNSVLWLMRYFA
jgi:soluble lytic murein transglycosylase-like protein